MVEHNRGFTLVELVTTVAIVGIVSGIASVSLKQPSQISLDAAREMQQQVIQARRAASSSDVTSVDVDLYNLANGTNFPPDARGTIEVDVLPTGNPRLQRITTRTMMFVKEAGALSLQLFQEKEHQFGKVSLRSALRGFDHSGSLPASGTAPKAFGWSSAFPTTVRALCYSNSTCDPITFYFSGMKTVPGARTADVIEVDRARLAVSPTGSVVAAVESLSAEEPTSGPDPDLDPVPDPPPSGGGKGKGK